MCDRFVSSCVFVHARGVPELRFSWLVSWGSAGECHLVAIGTGKYWCKGVLLPVVRKRECVASVMRFLVKCCGSVAMSVCCYIIATVVSGAEVTTMSLQYHWLCQCVASFDKEWNGLCLAYVLPWICFPWPSLEYQ